MQLAGNFDLLNQQFLHKVVVACFFGQLDALHYICGLFFQLKLAQIEKKLGKFIADDVFIALR